MYKTEFEKRPKQRKRPANDALEYYHERAKHPLSSRWVKHIQHLNKLSKHDRDATRNTRATPTPSTSQHVIKHRHSPRSQKGSKELKLLKLKSWRSMRKDGGASRCRKQDGSRRRGVDSSNVNNSGNSTSSEHETEPTQARSRLLHLFQDATVKATDDEKTKRKDKGDSSRHRHDGSRRHDVESSDVNNSGNSSTSPEDEEEPIHARSRLFRPFQDGTVKATDYEPEAKYQRFNPFAETVAGETITHEITHPAKAAGVQVVYTRNVFEAEGWLREQIIDCSTRAVGFDTEQKPQFVSKKHGGTENETAVLQLGVETSCLVLHIYHMDEMPKSLKSILRDENILKIGSGIDRDASKFTRESGLVCKGLVDTQDMATSLGLQKIGLKALAESFLGIELDKGVALTNWENFPLHLRQIEYAALDAWVGLKVYQEMKRQKKSSKDIKTSPKTNQSLLSRIINMKGRRKRK